MFSPTLDYPHLLPLGFAISVPCSSPAPGLDLSSTLLYLLLARLSVFCLFIGLQHFSLTVLIVYGLVRGFGILPIPCLDF